MPYGTQFRILGPLAAVRHGSELPLGGTRQRAMLGYLLLSPNQVVATSRLITALWGDAAPASARKVLQNTVWRLRRLFEPEPGTPESIRPDVELLTRAPGYLLRVEPAHVDLHRFRALAAEGRSELDAGAPAAAAELWRDALALWRGPVLADLVEDGVRWPELRAVGNARLDLLEDFFETELALGRHEAVAADLQATVRAEPRRERLLGQLMLTLYRCGRQTEALAAFDAARADLVDELGLEPGRELRDLRQAILTHDARLLYPGPMRTDRGGPASAVVGTAGGVPPAVGVRTDQRVPASAVVPLREGVGGEGSVFVAPLTDPGRGFAAESGVCAAADVTVTERKEVATLVLRVTFEPTQGRADAEDIDTALERADTAIRREIARFGGLLATRIGSLWVAFFGARRSRDDDALHAVFAALAIRHRIAGSGSATALPGVSVRAAVATGSALVRYQAEAAQAGRAPEAAGAPRVTGPVLDLCQSALPLIPRQEVWVTEETRRNTDTRVGYEPARATACAWSAAGLRDPAAESSPCAPLFGRDDELAFLVEAFRAGRGGGPVVVTAEAGLGKSRLLGEFEAVVRRDAKREDTDPLVVHMVPRLVDESLLGLIAEGLCVCCGLVCEGGVGVEVGGGVRAARTSGAALGAAVATPEALRERLWEHVHAAAETPREAEWLLSRLYAAFGAGQELGETIDLESIVTAWWVFLERLSARRRVAVLIDDLHAADDTVLDLVDRTARGVSGREQCADSGLFVLAAARPELAGRRPQWSAADTVTQVALRPLSDQDVDRQVRYLLREHGLPPEPAVASDDELAALLVSLADGNPFFAAEFVRSFVDGVRPGRAVPAPDLAARLLPKAVRRVIAARLDLLPDEAKTVLRDAAVVGDTVWSGAVAAACERGTRETEALLDALARHGLLDRAPSSAVDGDAQYTFRHGPVRHVAYARMPRAARAAAQARVQHWLEQRDDAETLRALTAAGPASNGLLRLAALTERWSPPTG
ncbi:BTAD domain-containing putative transcriptional regulator [Yinghuangia seranimata]|uniref:BTAD domain-containing putative transcriptional regulator n=1 Tax=Yinghuangia seranimata TaxID=408067 RepID=UPI00248B80D7|nr:BTAD domain-containing putative transcriptional regulator [Yinghuangia seranimata]MDI2132307.1 BTAD domain-containing putative transcriptional regulator [Yinghuangia seranimata]